MPFPFLTAHWKNLIVLNYEIDPALLLPFLPHGTEFDDFEGKTFISIVAFYFTRNKLFGVIPTFPAINFEEINLRFYVKRRCQDEIRRGVVFVKEYVPSMLVATTARTIYNEPYEAAPMQHDFSMFSDDDGGKILYGINKNGAEIVISASTDGANRPLGPNSIEHFILEHYWGYTKQKDGSTSEYRVEHAPWQYWKTSSVEVSENVSSLYPTIFSSTLKKPPHSSFIAKGSPVAVYAYQKIPPQLNM